MALTITSANAVYMLGIDSVFPTPQQIQQFGVDEAFDTEVAMITETQVGVDGEGVAGWVPREIRQTLTLLASSPSFLIFEAWVNAMDQAREVLYANGTIVIPSIGRKYSMAKGTLTRYPAIPNARRVLANRRFELVWLPSLGQPAITSAPA